MFGKKSEMSKKDMNFFSEFSTSGAQIASMLTIVFVVLIIFFVLAVGFWLFIVVQANGIQSEIDKINAEINDPANQSILEDYNRLTYTLDERREYLYVLTDLKSNLQANRFADTKNMDIITDNIPDDVILTELYYIDGAIRISGNSATYEGALNYAAQLQSKNLFVYIHIDEINYYDPGQDYPHDIAINVWRYNFTFTGSLESSYQVIMTRYFDGVPQSLLSIPTIREYVVGSPYHFTDISTYTVDGVEYKLSRIVINGNAVSPEALEIMLREDTITGIVLERTDVRLMYVEANAIIQEGGDVI